ncbi:MAG: tetratricopeptide repeat protein [Deltaproteobacteria bacterium]|nr:tetratricopeptide repeat protein [Deltaproteobacteria bacterium]
MTPIRDWITLGKRFFQEKEYDRAEEYLRRVVKETDKYADVYNMLGVIYHAQGRFADAIEALTCALQNNPHYTEALLNLAVLHNDLGEYAEARKLYERLRKRNGAAKAPGKPRAARDPDAGIEPVLKGKLTNMHADIADIYFGLGLYGQAVAEYRRALELNPTYTDIVTKLGVALREGGRLEESAKILREAVKLNAHYMQAKVQLGVTLYTMGKKAEAMKTWKETLKTDPHNTTAEMYLSLCEAK